MHKTIWFTSIFIYHPNSHLILSSCVKSCRIILFIHWILFSLQSILSAGLKMLELASRLWLWMVLVKNLILTCAAYLIWRMYSCCYLYSHLPKIIFLLVSVLGLKLHLHSCNSVYFTVYVINCIHTSEFLSHGYAVYSAMLRLYWSILNMFKEVIPKRPPWRR